MLRFAVGLSMLLIGVALPATASGAPTPDLVLAPPGAGAGALDRPVGLAVGADGHVWVADAGDDRIEELSATGAPVRSLGGRGERNGRFTLIGDVVATGRSVDATDCFGGRLQRFSRSDGGFRSALGTFGATKDGMRCPRGVAIGQDRYRYVADTGNDRVLVINPLSDMPFPRRIGAGVLRRPVGVGFDLSGNLLVTEGDPRTCAGSRVARYQRDGVRVGGLGTAGLGEGQLSCPTAVAGDSVGNIYVGDATGRVQAFTADGRYASTVARVGHPADLAVDVGCRLFVLDRDARRVLRFPNPSGRCTPLPAVAAGAEVASPASLQWPPSPALARRTFLMGAPSRLRLDLRRSLSVRVRCPRACLVTVTATADGRGRAGARRASLPARAAVALRVRLHSGDVAALRRALDRGRRPALEVVVAVHTAGRTMRRTARVLLAN